MNTSFRDFYWTSDKSGGPFLITGKLWRGFQRPHDKVSVSPIEHMFKGEASMWKDGMKVIEEKL